MPKAHVYVGSGAYMSEVASLFQPTIIFLIQVTRFSSINKVIYQDPNLDIGEVLESLTLCKYLQQADPNLV